MDSSSSNQSSGYGSIFSWWPKSSTTSSSSSGTPPSASSSYQNETMALLEQGGGGGGGGANHEKEEEYNKSSNKKADAANNRKRKLYFVGFMAAVGALIFVSCSSWGSRNGDGHKKPLHYSWDTNDSGKSTSRVPFPFTISSNKRRPLSTLHPVYDLGVRNFSRPIQSAPPQALTQTARNKKKQQDSVRSYPTNAWYQNMLLVRGEPTNVNRAYPMPFLVDAVGPIPGLRVNPNHVAASTSVVQVNTIEQYGLTVGAAPDITPLVVDKTGKHHSSTESTTSSRNAIKFSHQYTVETMTPLGFTLAWEKTFPMTSNIVKGMPYGTMKYDAMQWTAPKSTTVNGTTKGETKTTWYPTVASEIALASAPIVDGHKTKLTCGVAVDGGGGGGGSSSVVTHGNVTDDNETTGQKHHRPVTVERDIELHFASSDFTWLVFVSRPVRVQCVTDPKTGGIQLQFLETKTNKTTQGKAALENASEQTTTHTSGEGAPPFFIRVALTKVCTSNNNAIYCHHEQMLPGALSLGQGRYDDLLRNHSQFIPGPQTSFDYVVDQTNQEIQIIFDWDVKDMHNYEATVKENTMENDLIVYALPHHLDLMGTRNAPGYLKYCATTLIGPACLLSGSKWNMVERLPQIDLRAPRPPAPWAFEALAKSAREDIHFTLPKFYQKGAGDTYFSGKMLAKLARVLAVVEELKELCGQGAKESPYQEEYAQVCHNAKLPSDRDVNNAVASLRKYVEIWINGEAVTPFVYDDAWGGVVSCGCNNPDGGECRNKYPECPAFTDPGLNFGNAFYNDLHFHYGYHIYAAAVVSKFDPSWGMENFERVLLLVRNIANPSYEGDYFPAFRHKDWYQGHSWASGVVPPYLNGRNQESSSEAIAAYEAVALYGSVMASVWESENIDAYVKVAKDVQEAGQVLTATEIRSTRRYYHVRDSANANAALKIYPSEYSNHAIGMLWNTMAQYQTWFGGKPYLAVGIQLIPITPIAEQRDGLQWLTEMYPSFAEACSANEDCEKQGWSVLQLAALATIGHPEAAVGNASALSPEVFASAGGNGHSLTNTLWYIATRPTVQEPANIGNTTKENDEDDLHVLSHCFKPNECTDYVLDTIADEYTCRQRITDLMWTKGHTQKEACYEVAKIQFNAQCGACVPNATDTKSANITKAQCPPCTVAQCRSSLNLCPVYRQTFVCTEGPNLGGCSRFPWDVRSPQCTGCCELTECTLT